MTHTEHVLQAEFFHFRMHPDESMEELRSRLLREERVNVPLAIRGIETPSGIKTTIRLFDQHNCVTKRALYYRAVKMEFEAVVERQRLRSGGALAKWFVGRRLTKLACERGVARKTVLAALLETFLKRAACAIECRDRTFRPLSDNERHELQERIRQSTDFWLFVFQPNDLLSSTNKCIASVV